MSVKDKASFILVPSRYKASTLYPYRGTTLDSFDRNGAGSRYDAAGNISSVATDVPRVDFLNGYPELLLEQNTSNIFTNSSNFAGGWTYTNIALYGAYGISPSGANDSTLLREDATTNEHQFYQTGNYTTSNVYYSFSVFAKKAQGSRRLKLKVGCGGGEHRAIFDLDSGKVVDLQNGAQAASYMEDYGNGWWRCVMVYYSSYTGSSHCHQIMLCQNHENSNTYLGDGFSSLEIWGAQLELFNRATSYMATAGSYVSRGSDDLVLTKNILSDLNNKEGSVYIDYKQDSGLLVNGHGIIVHLVGDGSDEIQIGNSNSNDLYFAGWRNGASPGMQWNISYTGIDPDKRIRVVCTWTETEVKLYLNGVLVASSANTNVPTALKYLSLSYYQFSGGYHFYTRLKELCLFKSALTEAEAITLSSMDNYDDVVSRNGLKWETKSISDARITALQGL